LWITDEPLLQYLGVTATLPKFQFTFFPYKEMIEKLNEIKKENQEKGLNRLGILLGNNLTENTTKTITHTLWSLLNILPANTIQKPHRHNSVALDLCILNKTEDIYTLVGEELDEYGNIKNPVKCCWETGSIFITPPGLWHSHHNESLEEAYVLPIQDAGLYTYLRTLDIRFC
jgi:gentisate 1,2-dioxygenase